jgi:glycine cleavage system H protein
MYPSDRKYTKDFEWIRVDGTDATVGVTAHVLTLLKDLVAIDLPKVGRSLAQGEPFGSLESAKALTELTAPVSGAVIAVNNALEQNLKRLAADPYGTWIIKVKLKKPAEMETLLSHTEVAALAQRSAEPAPSGGQKPSPPNPAPQPTKPSPLPHPAPAPAPEPTPEQRRDMAIALLWSTRLRDRRLHGGDDAFGDRDYSGGGYFSWRQRDIVFTSESKPGGGLDRRYQWRDTRWMRVSSGGLSSTTSSHTDYAGTWKIEVTDGNPYLVMRDERGPLQFQLQEASGGGVLLNGRPYSVLRI